jgi:hypothetical protein
VQPFNLQIRGVEERPDRPAGDIIYVVKDLFTTRDGSWEPSHVPGAISQWARDAYLKPLGAPDFFDDAGADHHLFAAIIGLDGQLMRDQEVIFWSDGFAKLGDPTYSGYVSRLTKSHSGWANIVIGPSSNFIPERGEMGPWCWAPRGAAEVVCGGGMPAKQHVSTFVVWQAVRRPVEQPPAKPGKTGFNVFLPLVSGGARPAANAAISFGLPEPVVETAEMTGLSLLRAAAWTRVGIEFRPDSPLADYARRNALGMPVTQEFVMGEVMVQGYYGGIVYAPTAHPGDVRHVSW